MTNKVMPMYEKRYLELTPPTEADPRGDRERILDALKESYPNVRMSCDALKMLYPLCRNAGWHITVTLACLSGDFEVIKVEEGDQSAECYALGVDYGSTSITMELIELVSGKIRASQTMLNPQIPYGDEILSRIFFTKDNEDNKEKLRRISIECLNELTERCEKESGIPTSRYCGMVIAGNTTMVHFILGLFAWGIFQTPYAPVSTRFGSFAAKELGLKVYGYIYFVPAAANYLGGDILSGLMLTQIEERAGVSVFLDIGTNGELVIGNRDFLISGAGAAGPALEAGVSKYGMKAADGAVNHVRIENNELRLGVIGDIEPKGICGSGIVELIAEMFLNGWIDSSGRFAPEKSKRIVTAQGENGPETAVCYGSELTSEEGRLLFFQSDIDRFIQAKAAAHTMVASLMEYVGISLRDIDCFYLSGAFGTHADIESAVTIGLYPDIDRNKFVPLGNSSLKGALKILRDRTLTERIDRLIENISYVQFGEVKNFVENMRAAEFLPHTDQQSYPTVMENLRKHREKADEI